MCKYSSCNNRTASRWVVHACITSVPDVINPSLFQTHEYVLYLKLTEDLHLTGM